MWVRCDEEWSLTTSSRIYIQKHAVGLKKRRCESFGMSKLFASRRCFGGEKVTRGSAGLRGRRGHVSREGLRRIIVKGYTSHRLASHRRWGRQEHLDRRGWLE